MFNNLPISLRSLPQRPSLLGVVCCVAFAAMLFSHSTKALPSYAEQTGQACGACHAIGFGPALSSYGRQFKLNGYTWGENRTLPLASMIVSSFDSTDRALPEKPAEHFSNNGNGVLDEVSLFVAGRLFGNVGSFAQVTYSGVDRKTAWDNVDIRWARPMQLAGRSVVLGVSVNNSPTTQDLWSSTPVWGFPYAASELAPSPAASPLIVDGLAQNVLGSTVYAMVNDTVYVELGAYKGLSDRWLSNVGVDPEESPHAQGLIPYWRAVVQHQAGANYISGGIFGLSSRVLPEGSASQTDRYTDLGFDSVYQYDDGQKHAVTVNLAYIHEQRRLQGSFEQGAADATRNHLNTQRAEIAYGYRRTWIGSLGLFNTTGGRDMTLFAADPIECSATGSPESRGYTLLFEFVPFGKINSPLRPYANARFGLQYTIYDRFNGGSSNYDGFGRSASDNNTLFIYTWLAL